MTLTFGEFKNLRGALHEPDDFADRGGGPVQAAPHGRIAPGVQRPRPLQVGVEQHQPLLDFASTAPDDAARFSSVRCQNASSDLKANRRMTSSQAGSDVRT